MRVMFNLFLIRELWKDKNTRRLSKSVVSAKSLLNSAIFALPTHSFIAGYQST
jgi:hypothetical protein